MNSVWHLWQGKLACPVCRSFPLALTIEQENSTGVVAGTYRCPECSKQYPVNDGIHHFMVNNAPRLSQGGGLWKAEEFVNLLPESGLYKTHAEWLMKKLGYSSRVAEAVSNYESRVTKGLMLDLIRTERPRTVLDLGCGVGYLTFELLASAGEVGMQVACVDVLPAHVRFVRLRQVEEAASSVLPILGDAERLPFGNGSIDALMGSEVMEHVPDPAACAREILRILAPGGLAVLSTPNREPYERYNRVRLALRRALGRPMGPGEDFFDNPLRHEDLVAIFSEAGFQIERVTFGIKVPMSKRFFMYLPQPLARMLVLFLERVLPGKTFGVSVLVKCRKPGCSSNV